MDSVLSKLSFFLDIPLRNNDDSLSISANMAFDFLDKIAYKTRDGIAAIKPSSVVINASEIPSDKLLASPVPKE